MTVEERTKNSGCESEGRIDRVRVWPEGWRRQMEDTGPEKKKGDVSRKRERESKRRVVVSVRERRKRGRPVNECA